MKYIISITRVEHLRGEKAPGAKLTEKDVFHIRQDYREGFTQAEIAKFYSVSSGAIHSVLTGKNWRHLCS